ncbi:MAG: alkaline phosphatase [Myxococcota bacterium]|nr:alkaline phosphatase [Myxococcota bacterium]
MLIPLLIVTGCTPSTETSEPDSDTQGATAPEPDTDTIATGDSGKASDSGPPQKADKPIVIVMIGDGMGVGQRDTTSLYAHGETGKLFLESLPYRSEVSTASLSGVTDSAASASAMATGQFTWNGVIGQDREAQEVESLTELARSLGLAVGVVTTAEVTHATPAAFTAHELSRSNGIAIANDQFALLPDVLLGGGAAHYLPAGEGSQREDGGLIKPLEAAGCSVLYDRDALLADDPTSAGCLFGLFATSHLTYMLDRPEDTQEPTLQEMTQAALDRLDQDEDGFFLMIEGARIDMAGHSNELARMIDETLAFDATVELVHTWLAEQDNALLIVTADHETGGLELLKPGAIGEYSEVAWRSREHSNAAIALHATGAGAEVFDGQSIHHPWIHATVSAHLEARAVVPPEVPLLPDGMLSDHRWRASEQQQITDFGSGFNQLDALTLDVSSDGLFIGVEGLFEWDNNAVMVLIDHDPGQGTGTDSLSGAFSDNNGTLESILSNVALTAPPVEGFGADMAVLTLGGKFSQLDAGLPELAGIRGTSTEYGAPDDLWWLSAAISFGDDVRISGSSGSAITERGVEMFVPWESLYPGGKGSIPVGAAVSLAAVLVNSTGTAISNQLLPPHSEEPDGATVSLPGVVRFVIDSDSDGVPDGDAAPEVLLK